MTATQRVTRSTAAAAAAEPVDSVAPVAQENGEHADVTAHLENEVRLRVMSMNMLSDDAKLAFYASYHSNQMNKAIHFVFIPQILWSSLILLSFLNLPGFTYVDVGPGLSFRPSVGMLLAFAFQFYYIFLDEFVGVSVYSDVRPCLSF